MNAHIVSGTASQPQRAVLTPADGVEAAQATGKWISTDRLWEVRR